MLNADVFSDILVMLVYIWGSLFVVDAAIALFKGIVNN